MVSISLRLTARRRVKAEGIIYRPVTSAIEDTLEEGHFLYFVEGCLYVYVYVNLDG